MVTSVREKMAVYDNEYMKLYRAIEERGLTLAFHSGGPHWGSNTFQSCNRFIAAHARLWFNILHCTNWVVNGMGERFPNAGLVDRGRACPGFRS